MTIAHLDDSETVMAAAARWLALVHSGEMTEIESRDFESWVKAQPAHRLAWLRMEQLWLVTGAVADDPAIEAVRYNDVEEAGSAVSAITKVRRKRRWPIGIAASVALGLAVTWALSGAGPFADWSRVDLASAHVLRTGLGQRSSVTLGDGSVVTLDTDSEVHVESMGSTRRLALTRGRAYFKVAHDASRPFLVEANGTTVRAIGTAFSVRLDGRALTVTLVEGRVRVEEPRTFLERGLSANLSPGAKLTVNAAEDDWTIEKVNADQQTSWLKGQLAFVREPLSHAIAEMNRYSERKIVFSGGRVPDARIVGAFRTGDVDGFAKAAELSGFGRIVARTSNRIELTAD